MMNGRVLIILIIAVAMMMGVGLVYFNQYYPYTSDDGAKSVTVSTGQVPVRDYRGIDGRSSPLNLRACFVGDFWDFWAFGDDGEAAQEATPLTAPRWFDCFDAGAIDADIRGGVARVLRAKLDEPLGFDTYIAYYPDGRGFMWRQINMCGAALFAGNPLPAACRDRAGF